MLTGTRFFAESSSCSTSPCLDVKLQTGLGPLDDDGNYAPSSFNPATGTITIYTLYGPPPGNQTTPLDDASVRFYTAHEVGHALGLKEDSCSGGVMNGANFGGASTAVYEECQTADFMNTTYYEEFSYNPSDPNQDPCRNCPCQCFDWGCDWSCSYSPILIDLDGKSYELTGLNDPVNFDIDADGRLKEWAGRPETVIRDLCGSIEMATG